MLCDMCNKKTASYHSRTNINGVVSEVHLCEDCLEKSNYNPLSIFTRDFYAFDDVLGNYIDTKRMYDTECKVCGTKFATILNSSKVGCGECYKQFRKEILSATDLLNYGGEKHIGKGVNNTESKPTNTVDDKISKLEAKLKEAVEKENYEEAAVIKKQIIALKEGKTNE